MQTGEHASVSLGCTEEVDDGGEDGIVKTGAGVGFFSTTNDGTSDGRELGTA